MATPSDGETTFEALFDAGNDPQYIRSLDGSRFYRVNRAFEALLGYSREELEGGKVAPSDVVHPDDRARYSEVRVEHSEAQERRYDLRILTKTGEAKDIEFSVRRVAFQGQPAVLGSARDVTERRRLEAQLKEEIAIQRRKTIEAAKASVRIWQLTEKIRNAPKLSTALLDAETVDECLRRAAEILTDPDGLNYARVTMHLVEGDTLVQRWPAPKEGPKRRRLAGRHRLARLARGEEEMSETPGQVLLPLRGHGRVLGVLQIAFEEDDRVLFDGSQTVRTGQLDIVRTLANSLGVMIENVRLLEEVRRQTVVDELTGVFNRRYLDEKLRDEVKRARRYKRDLSLLMMDLDHFKPVNDTLGHAQGDQTLKEAARILKSQSREIDVLCRYGGDEFTLLLPETDVIRAAQKAERLRARVEANSFTNQSDPQKAIRLSLSIGVAALSADVSDEGTLLKRADEACYESKRSGRNRVTVK